MVKLSTKIAAGIAGLTLGVSGIAAAPQAGAQTAPQANLSSSVGKKVLETSNKGPIANINELRKLYVKTNAERIKRGLKPVHFDAGLAAGATAWSVTMAATKNFKHQTGNYWENTYAGPTVTGAHHAWMTSKKGHRENLLKPSHTRVGIGYAKALDGTIYVTQRFR